MDAEMLLAYIQRLLLNPEFIAYRSAAQASQYYGSIRIEAIGQNMETNNF